MAEKRALDLTRLGFSHIMIINTSILILYWLLSPLVDHNVVVESTNLSGFTTIGEFVESLFVRDSILYKVVISFLLFINSLCVSRLFLRNFVNIKSRHIGSLLYMLMVVSSDNSMNSIALHLSMLFMLIGMDYVLSAAKHRLSSTKLFKSTLFISLASTIYMPAILGVVVPMVYVFINIRYNHKEFISSIVGLVLPLVLISYICWVVYGEFFMFINSSIERFIASFELVAIDNIDIYAILNSILVVASVALIVWTYILYLKYDSKRTKIKKSLIIFISFIIAIALFSVLFTTVTATMLPLYAAPAALIISLMFNINENIFLTNIIFVLFVCLTIITLFL